MEGIPGMPAATATGRGRVEGPATGNGRFEGPTMGNGRFEGPAMGNGRFEGPANGNWAVGAGRTDLDESPAVGANIDDLKCQLKENVLLLIYR